MNKKIFFIGVGAIVLALSADIAVKASVRSNPSSIYVSTIGGNCRQLVIALPGAATFTTGGTGTQARISIYDGLSDRKIWGTFNCATGAKPVHFNG